LQDNTLERISGRVNVVTSDNYTNFHFNVTTVKDRVHLEQNLAVVSVSCDGNRLTVGFNGTDAASSFASTLNAGSTVITLLKEWGCGSSSGVQKVAWDPMINMSESGTQVRILLLSLNLTIVLCVCVTVCVCVCVCH
jgi:hypothetical protein